MRRLVSGRRAPMAVWVLGLVLSTAVLAGVCWPLSDEAAGTSARWGDRDLWGAIAAAGLLQAGLVVAGGRRGSAAVALLPLALVGWWAADLRSAHQVQARALQTFHDYTHRFPQRALGEPYLHARDGSRVIVCAPQRSRRRPGLEFCAGVDTARDAHRVGGTFRLARVNCSGTYSCQLRTQAPSGGLGFGEGSGVGRELAP